MINLCNTYFETLIFDYFLRSLVDVFPSASPFHIIIIAPRRRFTNNFFPSRLNHLANDIFIMGLKATQLETWFIQLEREKLVTKKTYQIMKQNN